MTSKNDAPSCLRELGVSHLLLKAALLKPPP